jgi:hypothetical protein
MATTTTAAQDERFREPTSGRAGPPLETPTAAPAAPNHPCPLICGQRTSVSCNQHLGIAGFWVLGSLGARFWVLGAGFWVVGSWFLFLADFGGLEVRKRGFMPRCLLMARRSWIP